MESEYKNSLTKSHAKFIKVTLLGWTGPLFLPLLVSPMRKMLIFWKTNTTISSSIDANSTFGNTAMY